MVHRDLSYFPYTKVGVDQPLAVSYYSTLLLRFTLMNLPHHASEERDYIAMRTMTVVRPYLAAAFLVVIGLIAYGCGDSATVSEPAALGNLSVSDGTLEPPFTPATTSYIVQLPINISSTTITASPQVAGDSIRIDNQAITSQTITLSSPGAEQSITIVVTDTGTGGSSKSYTVQVKRAALNGNNSLDSLGISPGALAPTFEAGVLRYTANVANGIGSVTITPTLSDPVATITVNGQPVTSGQARSVNLQGGGQITTIPITITAQNESTKTYEVSVSRGPSNNNNLQGLTITPGTLDPSFRANRTGYTVDVSSGVGSVTIAPRLQDSTATMTVNGAITNSGQAQIITLNPAGQDTSIAVVVTAQNNTTKLYSVTVERAAPDGNNNLQSLTVNRGTLVPTFGTNTRNYTVQVGSSIGNITLAAEPQVSTSSLAIEANGALINTQPIPLLGPGFTTVIKTRVTAQNRQVKEYTINVVRAALNGNNNLRSLTVSPGNLTFDPDDQDYNVSLLSNVTSVVITAAPQDGNARVTINGQPSPTNINLGAPGPETRSTIPIIVTAQNNETKTYNVTFIRAALGGNNNLQSLAVSQPGLSPTPFSADRTVYRLNVGNNIDSITVTASPQVTSSSMSMKVNNGVPINLTAGQASPSISLAPGPSDTEIEILVKAPNGTEKPYSITVTRAEASSNNNLSALSVNGSSVPGFTQGTLDYTVNVASGVNEVTVSATKADSNATMAVGSVTVPPGTPTGQTTVPVNATPVSIAVTAPGGGAP
ncbi:MAG: cadherin-like beta sandwich domain-containing protein, partial [Nitrospira sp.]